MRLEIRVGVVQTEAKLYKRCSNLRVTIRDCSLLNKYNGRLCEEYFTIA